MAEATRVAGAGIGLALRLLQLSQSRERWMVDGKVDH
jgi:hypothetical protein